MNKIENMVLEFSLIEPDCVQWSKKFSEDIIIRSSYEYGEGEEDEDKNIPIYIFTITEHSRSTDTITNLYAEYNYLGELIKSEGMMIEEYDDPMMIAEKFKKFVFEELESD
jgi:hypothetical protein